MPKESTVKERCWWTFDGPTHFTMAVGSSPAREKRISTYLERKRAIAREMRVGPGGAYLKHDLMELAINVCLEAGVPPPEELTLRWRN